MQGWSTNSVCACGQRYSRGQVTRPSSVSIATLWLIVPPVSVNSSLWLYCHRFGVNSHSVAVIATRYPVAIAMAFQHTASICTFEDTKHLRLILLLFCQQVAIRKHAACSRSGSKNLGKSELRLLPHPKLKSASVQPFCGNLVGGTLLWPIRLVLHNFHTS